MKVSKSSCLYFKLSNVAFFFYKRVPFFFFFGKASRETSSTSTGCCLHLFKHFRALMSCPCPLAQPQQIWRLLSCKEEQDRRLAWCKSLQWHQCQGSWEPVGLRFVPALLLHVRQAPRLTVVGAGFLLSILVAMWKSVLLLSWYPREYFCQLLFIAKAHSSSDSSPVGMETLVASHYSRVSIFTRWGWGMKDVYLGV